MNNISYYNWNSIKDNAKAEQIGLFIKHNWIQQSKSHYKVSKDAGISRSTLSLLEKGQTVTLRSFLRVIRFLDLLDFMDLFKYQNIINPISIAKMDKKKRKL